MGNGRERKRSQENRKTEDKDEKDTTYEFLTKHYIRVSPKQKKKLFRSAPSGTEKKISIFYEKMQSKGIMLSAQSLDLAVKLSSDSIREGEGTKHESLPLLSV
jgi:hypothetical protein